MFQHFLFLYMENVASYSNVILIKKILGNNIQFISDCMLFPKNGIRGKVINYKILNTGEILFKVKTSSGKSYDVGTKTANLQFQIL